MIHHCPPGPAWPDSDHHSDDVISFFPKVLLAPVPLASLLILNILSFFYFRASVLMIPSAWNIHPLCVLMAVFLIPSRSWLLYNFCTKAIQNSTSSFLRELSVPSSCLFYFFSAHHYKIFFVYSWGQELCFIPFFILSASKKSLACDRYAINIVEK